jgi:membrane protease YdiL (CAAX protease family)
VVGFFTSLVVGAFEEYAFRGPLLFAFQQRMPILTATLLSSALFTVFHIQAQPLEWWLEIFFAGVVFASIRLRGVSLVWLALIHTLIDTLDFVFPVHAPRFFTLPGIITTVGLLAYAFVIFPRPKSLPRAQTFSIEQG